MKITRTFITAIITFISLATANAQVEITPFGGYVFKSSFNIYNGKAYIKEAPAFGFHVTVPFKYSEGAVEFTYQRQDSKIQVKGLDDVGATYFDTLDVGINYILIGGIYEPGEPKSKVKPYGGITVGLGIINSKEAEASDNIVPFSFGFKAGAKFFVSERIGFRLQGDLNLMMIFAGSGMGCYVGTSGSGCGFSITTTSSCGQFGLNGGIIIRLAKSKPEEKPQIGM